MKNAKPLYELETHYRIEVQGMVDVEWLKSFDSSIGISFYETLREESITILDVRTDQSGIVGLVRRLHGLGMTILQFQIVLEGNTASEIEGQL